MREILFRGKREDNGEWIQGDFCSPCNIVFLENGYDAVLGKDDCPICNDFRVLPETLGQYTGKDLNGERLFEGDIVETFEDYDDKFGYPVTSHFYSVVVWDEENFYWAFKTDGYIQAFNDWTWDNTTKVGNIHDNPELLKGGVE